MDPSVTVQNDSESDIRVQAKCRSVVTSEMTLLPGGRAIVFYRNDSPTLLLMEGGLPIKSIGSATLSRCRRIIIEADFKCLGGPRGYAELEGIFHVCVWVLGGMQNLKGFSMCVCVYDAMHRYKVRSTMPLFQSLFSPYNLSVL
ncbi:hypothetical protein KP509_1Z209200 [Ceratopteris richardii]|nr:hypothetical protein KP509_1Z209200 [Ceratopteris richardii]